MYGMGKAYECPILTWMMSLNHNYSKEEYDVCHALVNECVSNGGVPYKPSDPDSFRNLLLAILPLFMMRHRRIPRAKWRDCVSQNGKHWIEQDDLPPEKFLNSLIGYHLARDPSLLGMAMTQGPQSEVPPGKFPPLMTDYRPAQDSPYGGVGHGRTQNQRQYGPRLGGFASVDHDYGNQRDFYDTYTKQTGFGNRNPQQFPPPPVPLSNPHPQTWQYYDTPYNPGGIPQSYAKYPAVFQPGLSGPKPTLNQTDANVDVGPQSQNNPYGQVLCQQGGYDGYQQHPHYPQHQHLHALGLGQGGGSVGASDYSKQVYGGAGQGFMGLGGQSGGAGNGTGAGPLTMSAPEPPYGYRSESEAGVSGSLGPMQSVPDQIQPQGPGAAQEGQGGPQGQGYYEANHFGGDVDGTGVGGGIGGPRQGVQYQQGELQGHLGYPHGATEGSFYPY